MQPIVQPVNVAAAFDGAVLVRRQQLAFIVGESTRRRNNLIAFLGSLRAATPSPPESVVAADSSTTSSWDWDCVALHETGSDWTMHGSRYSSALGVMNQAVRENAPPEVAERILNGTASRQEQIDMAQGIVNRFGIDAWAASTVAKCAR